MTHQIGEGGVLRCSFGSFEIAEELLNAATEFIPLLTGVSGLQFLDETFDVPIVWTELFD